MGSEVTHVDFRLGSTETAVAYGIEVKVPDVADASRAPVAYGPCDPRMGPETPAGTCETCGLSRQCPGHPGFLRLVSPVYNPPAVREAVLALRATCFACGYTWPGHAAPHAPPAARLAAAAEAGDAAAACPACGAPHPRVMRVGASNVLRARARAGGREVRLWPAHAAAVLARTAPFGFAWRPADLVLWAVVVSPPGTRPPARGFAGATTHETTSLLQHIAARGDALGAPPEPLRRLELDADGLPVVPPDEGPTRGATLSLENYETLVHTMIMGSSAPAGRGRGRGAAALQVGSRPVAGHLGGLAKKKGVLRGRAAGKSVLNIARSTISGNPALGPTELGVPLEFARTLRVREAVGAHNYERLLTHYLNARGAYPGASAVLRDGRRREPLGDAAPDRPLAVGDVLERDLVDGDPVWFNRAPTLERSSYTVMAARVVDGVTFQFNVDVCPLFNADFDGDAMTAFPAYTEAARAEAAALSGVEAAFISPKTGAPAIGSVLDTIWLAAALTAPGARLGRPAALAVLAADPAAAARLRPLAPAMRDPPDSPAPAPGQFDDAKGKKKAKGGRAAKADKAAKAGAAEADKAGEAGAAGEDTASYSGAEVLGALLAGAPVAVARAPKGADPQWPPDGAPAVTRVAGGSLQGVVDAALLKKGAGGLYQAAAREHGAAAALALMYGVQRAALAYGRFCGATVAFGDVLPPARARARVAALVAAAEADARAVEARLERGELVPPLGVTPRAHYEALMVRALGFDEDEAVRALAGALSPHNGLVAMARTGAKGDKAYLVRVVGALGLVTINGARLTAEASPGRPDPYSPRYPAAPAARGFVAASFAAGLPLRAFFAANQAGREDLIKKALSTADSGYLNRRLVMYLSTAEAGAHASAGKAARVTQPLYGDDGLDPRRIERVSFGPPADAGDYGAGPGGAALRAAHAALWAWRGAALAAHERANLGAAAPAPAAAVDPARLAAALGPADDLRGADGLGAAGLADNLDRNCAALAAFAAALPTAWYRRGAGRSTPPTRAAARPLALALLSALPPARLARLAPAALGRLLDEVWARVGRARVAAGLAVGVLAAQAIAEPLTQAFLNSIKTVAGPSSKAVAGRVFELINAQPREREAAPRMVALLRGAPTEAQARAVAAELELVPLGALLAGAEALVEDPAALLDDARAAAAYPPRAGDRAWVRDHAARHPLERRPADLAAVCWRLSFDRLALALKGVSLADVARALAPRHTLAWTAPGAAEPAMRVWTRARDREARRDLAAAEAALLATPVRGLKLETGVVDLIRLPNGMTVAIPGSISFDKMSEDEFIAFFRKAEEWLAATYGYVNERAAA